jgi:putative FmdB family regulatory protein
MPTYEYQCDVCHDHFERFQQMTDEPLTKCPGCGGPVRRLIGTGAGILFKGSGFYATDYAKSSSGTRCGRDTTCCGSDTPCVQKPCEE